MTGTPAIRNLIREGKTEQINPHYKHLLKMECYNGKMFGRFKAKKISWLINYFGLWTNLCWGKIALKVPVPLQLFL